MLWLERATPALSCRDRRCPLCLLSCSQCKLRHHPGRAEPSLRPASPLPAKSSHQLCLAGTRRSRQVLSTPWEAMQCCASSQQQQAGHCASFFFPCHVQTFQLSCCCTNLPARVCCCFSHPSFSPPPPGLSGVVVLPFLPSLEPRSSQRLPIPQCTGCLSPALHLFTKGWRLCMHCFAHAQAIFGWRWLDLTRQPV